MIDKFINKVDSIYLLKTPSRFTSIEGLRAWAVMMVFHVHIFGQYYLDYYFVPHGGKLHRLFKVLHAGHVGVDLFFVISGFLIFRSLQRHKPSFAAFCKQRVNRLLPAHALILLWLAFPAFNLQNFLINLAFLPVFIKDGQNYNFVTWSLGWEWLFYGIAFVVVLLTRDKRLSRFVCMIGFFTIGLFLLQQFASETLANVYHIIVPDPGRFVGFFVGVCIAYLEPHLANLAPLGKWTLIVASYLAFVSIFLLRIWWSYKAATLEQINPWHYLFFLLIDLSFGVLLLRLIIFKGILGFFFQLKPLRIVGQISYSFYLVHAMIGIPLARTLLPLVNSFSGMAAHYMVSLLVTFLVSSFVFYYLERPYFLARA